MKNAAACFVGVHDFMNFSRYQEGKNPMREILNCEMNEDKNFFTFDVIGKSFLHQMVRRMVKAILDVGTLNISVDQIKRLLKKTIDPSDKLGPAPLEPKGCLILYEIGNDLNFEIDEYTRERMRRIFKRKMREHLLKEKTFNAFLEKMC